MKKILSVLFSRMFIVLVLVLIQLAVLIGTLLLFSNYAVYFYWVCIAVSLVAVIRIVNNRMEPGYKIAWIVPIMVFPIFGGLLYFMLGGNKMTRRMRKKLDGMDMKMKQLLSPDFHAEHLAVHGLNAVTQARYMEQYAFSPVYGNTASEYFKLGDDVFPAMIKELRAAKAYIFLEFFIIHPGIFWDSVLEVLEEKAAQGVEVRVMYDDMGSVFCLPRHYDKLLQKKGIRCLAFNRFIPVMSLRHNNRDHRKLCIIDGHTAFTGGMNLADEYINREDRFGHWKDSMIGLKGEAVWSMTVMFLAMWDFNSDGEEAYESYRPRALPPEAMVVGEKEFVQPYMDSPLDHEAVGETVYLNLITKAKRYIYITTPYLIISNAVQSALTCVAKTGVDVRIITPHIPDKKTVFQLTRSHYLPLLEAGVRIFEYTPGFMHAKNFAVDDRYGTVGTINLDYRSLFLHFENGVFLYHTPSVLDIKRDFLDTQAKSQEVTIEQCKNIPLPLRVWIACLRIIEPLL